MAHGYSFVAALLLGLAAAGAGARAEGLTVDPAACRWLETYRPEPGQDPTYRPGEDVRGRPVAPADLGGGSRLQLPERFEFEVLVRPRETGRLRDSRIAVGRVTVLPDGRLLWNGRPLDEPRRAALLELCARQRD